MRKNVRLSGSSSTITTLPIFPAKRSKTSEFPNFHNDGELTFSKYTFPAAMPFFLCSKAPGIFADVFLF